jgi:hypothetical protein
MLGWLEQAGALCYVDGGYKSEVRYASFDGGLVMHSAWPVVNERIAMYFGADSYRFAAFLERVLSTAKLGMAKSNVRPSP